MQKLSECLYECLTLMAFTRFAVQLATPFADWTKCRLATGLLVVADALRHMLHRVEVCLAIVEAAVSTWSDRGHKVN